MKSINGFAVILLTIFILSTLHAYADRPILQTSSASLESVKIQTSQNHHTLSKAEAENLVIKNQNRDSVNMGSTDYSQSVNAVAGGSTGVGGGGDPASISLKIVTLARLGQQKNILMLKYHLDNQAYERLIDRVLSLKIEPDPKQISYAKYPAIEEIVVSDLVRFETTSNQKIAYLNVNLFLSLSKSNSLNRAGTDIADILINTLVGELGSSD